MLVDILQDTKSKGFLRGQSCYSVVKITLLRTSTFITLQKPEESLNWALTCKCIN